MVQRADAVADHRPVAHRRRKRTADGNRGFLQFPVEIPHHAAVRPEVERYLRWFPRGQPHCGAAHACRIVREPDPEGRRPDPVTRRDKNLEPPVRALRHIVDGHVVPEMPFVRRRTRGPQLPWHELGLEKKRAGRSQEPVEHEAGGAVHVRGVHGIDALGRQFAAISHIAARRKTLREIPRHRLSARLRARARRLRSESHGRHPLDRRDRILLNHAASCECHSSKNISQ